MIGTAGLTGCGDSDDEADETTTTTSSEESTTSSSAPTSAPTATGAPTTEAASGEAGPGCVNGWTTPEPGTAQRQEPLDLICEQMGITGEFEVVEMRYFTGPEVPWILEPRPEVVERWYVKAALVDDPSFEARWIVEARDEAVRGIAAAAPVDSAGYQSPDWMGFVGDGAPQPVPGLPGQWQGSPYDFVTGEDDGGNPGLPEENERCLDGS
jgi:hypothetical protein